MSIAYGWDSFFFISWKRVVGLMLVLAASVSVLQAATPQTITFAALADRLTTDGAFGVTATASSGLPVELNVVSPAGVVTQSGNTLTPTGTAGAVTVRARQAGDGTYEAAAVVYRSFIVAAAGQGFVKLAKGIPAWHSAGIRVDGSLWTWGANSEGELGDGTRTQRPLPVRVMGGGTWSEVACGAWHTVALRSDGTLWAWGYNEDGQLGDGTTTMRTSPVQIGVGSIWTAVGCGDRHSLAVRADGTLWAWGKNASAQVGDGTKLQRNAPVQIGSASTWAGVSGGVEHSLAVRTDGTLWAWGNNYNVQLGTPSVGEELKTPGQVGSDTTWATAVCGAFHSMALRTDGTLWGWGANWSGATGTFTSGLHLQTVPTQVESALPWVSVSCGQMHTLAIRADGTLWAWGDNGIGQLGNGVPISTNQATQVGSATDWTAVAGGSQHSLALRSDGTLWAWGDNRTGQFGDGMTASEPVPTPAGLPAAWASLSNGGSHSAAIRADGTLWTWGVNSFGQLGDGTRLDHKAPAQVGTETNWTAVSCGELYTLALRSDGTLWGWGDSSSSQLGGAGGPEPTKLHPGTTWTAISAGVFHSLALRSDGTLWAWGTNWAGQAGPFGSSTVTSISQVGTATNWTACAAGGYHSVALRGDGTLWAWGSNGQGELGNGTTTSGGTPTQVGTATDWVAVAGGTYHTLGQRADGTLWAWGYNGAGQLGDGTTVSRSTPVLVGGGIKDWVQISCGDGHNLARRADGTLWAWGGNIDGQLGNGGRSGDVQATPAQVGSASDWVLVDAGGMKSAAVSADGTLWTWGQEAVRSTPEGSRPALAWPARAAQALTSVLPATLPVGAPFALPSTATSGLPVTYTVSGAAATLSGNGVTPTATGLLHITAYQEGDNAWHAAPFLRQTVLVLPIAPEVEARGNGQVIAQGDATPAAGDGTDFGAVSPLAGAGVRTFTLANVGYADLSVGGVTISGAQAGDFSVTSQPAGTAVAAGGSTTFEVMFNPAVTGLRQAVVSVVTNDADENPVTFAVQGTGLATQQEITFPAVADVLTTSGPIALGATAGSGLPVTYSVVSTGGVATVSGSTVTLSGVAGSVTIKASQAGNGLYGAAAEVYRTFAVGNAAQRFVKLANGLSHSAGIAVDGTLWTWGGNFEGQLGSGDWVSRGSPGQVGTGTNWAAVACGSTHTVALRTDGTLWAWGTNWYGQTGIDDWAEPTVPTQIGTATTWSGVACGENHTVGLRSDGTLWAWGKNENGQLGDGSVTQRGSPVQVGTGTTWDKVVCGPNHTLARRSDGTLWAWGKNDAGQLGDGSQTQRLLPVQVGTATNWATVASGGGHTLAIRSDGTLWGWGENWGGQLGDPMLPSQQTTPVQIAPGTTWSAAAVAGTTSLALRSDGTLWTWGTGDYGLLGEAGEYYRFTPAQVGTATTWAALSAGGNTAMALRADGTLWAWGFNDAGQVGDGRTDRQRRPAQPAIPGRFTHVSGYDTHCMARREDGTLWGWGFALSGQLGIPPTGALQTAPVQAANGTDWASVYCGRYYTLAHKADGTLWAWGDNQAGQLGDGTTITRTNPVQIGPAGMYPVVACGYLYTLALRADGTLWAWGDNQYGQLGDGTTTRRLSPVQIGTAKWKTVACGFNHSVGVRADGTLWAWGINSSYQLGDGTTTQRLSPVQVGSATDWTAAGTGYNCTLAVRGGTLWGWGNNNGGVLDNDFNTSLVTTPTQLGTATHWVAVDASFSHAVARRTDGTLWSWGGGNSGGELGRDLAPGEPRNVPGQVGSGTNWATVAAADFTNIGLRSDGTLWSWGGGANGLPGDVEVKTPRSIWPLASTQTLTLAPLPALVVGQPVTVSASATSGLPVTFTVAGPATLNGNVLTPTGPGAITVAAYQDGDAAWKTAESVMQTVIMAPEIEVTGGSQSIACNDATPASGDGTDFGSVTTLTGTVVRTFTVSNTGSTPLHLGSVTVDGAQAAEFTLSSAPAAVVAAGWATSFQITFNPAAHGLRQAVVRFSTDDADENPFSFAIQGTDLNTAQEVTFPALGYRLSTDGPVTLAATSTSGLPITYSLVGPGGVATLAGNTLTLTGAPGVVTVRASQGGGGPYDAAADVYQSFVVGAAAQRFVKIASSAASGQSAGIRADGTLWTWRDSLSPDETMAQVGTDTSWVSVACGELHTMALRADGTLWGWGSNLYSQLGISNGNASVDAPAQIGTQTNWKAVACGQRHTMALRTDGTLWAWGSNNFGQFGNGNVSSSSTPVQVGSATNWAAVACGAGFTLALRLDGTLWATGMNSSGQLGLGGTGYFSALLARVGTATNWAAVACGEDHSAGVRTDGTLWAWGRNNYGQLATGDHLDSGSVPVQVGVATDWAAVACGADHVLARRTDGTLWAWGGNYYGQTTGFANQVETVTQVGDSAGWGAIAAGSAHSLALREDGSLWGCGGYDPVSPSADKRLRPTPMGSSTGWTVAAAGPNRSAALRANGTLWNWGLTPENESFFSGSGTVETPVQEGSGSTWTAVSCGSYHSVALRSDGTLWAWGVNSSGEVGDGTYLPRETAVQVGTASNWTAVKCGDHHTLALRSDGTLWAWGANNSGQLGNATSSFQSTPVQVGSATTWSAISCGLFHCHALRSDGTLWAWGQNYQGQLGDGTQISRSSPVQIGTGTTWAQIGAGHQHTLAVRTDGTLWAWGSNGYGQLGDGSTTGRYAPVQIGNETTWASVGGGEQHSLATRSNGTLWTWGYNIFGQLGDGTTTARSSPAQIGSGTRWLCATGGRFHSLAVCSDGTLWSWGSNRHGQLGSGKLTPDQDNHLLRRLWPQPASQSLVFPALARLVLGLPATLAATASSGLPIVYSIAGPATLSGSTLTATGLGEVHITAYQKGDASWLPAEVFTQTLTVIEGLTQQSWRQTYFGTTANAGTAADTHDADGDGLVNLVEYAFGLSPVAGGSLQLPQAVKNGVSFTVDFVEPGGVGGVVYGASYSPNLLPGSWIAIPDTGTGGGMCSARRWGAVRRRCLFGWRSPLARNDEARMRNDEGSPKGRERRGNGWPQKGGG